MPEAVKFPPAQDVALLELQESVEDCPAVTVVGLAARETVGAAGGGAGGAVKAVGMQEVRELPLPQQVLNNTPPLRSDGFEVWPQESCMTIPFAASDKLGVVWLAQSPSNEVSA